MNKFYLETIKYYVEDALVELVKIEEEALKNNLKEGKIFPLMEHSMHMLNAAYNMSFLNRKEIAEMAFEEWEKYLLPPSKIFSKTVKNKEGRIIKNETVVFLILKGIKILNEICKEKRFKMKIFPSLETAIKYLNFTFNARYLNKDFVGNLSDKQKEYLQMPPSKIFPELK